MISVEVVSWKSCSHRLLKIRTAVFVEEQGVPEDLEHDHQDEGSIHVILQKDGVDLATGRLLTDGHIGRVCVLKEFRGQGFGLKVMKAIIDQAIERGFGELVLSSQVHALPFYEKLGFEVSSEEYSEAGIPHREMKLKI